MNTTNPAFVCGAAAAGAFARSDEATAYHRRRLRFSDDSYKRRRTLIRCSSLFADENSQPSSSHDNNDTNEESNPIGVHALVFSGDLCSTAGCARAVDGAARAGYDLLEVPLMSDDILIPTLSKQLRSASLEVTCSLGLGFDDDISSSDDQIARRGEQRLLKAVQNASTLGSRTLTGVVFSALGKYSQPRTQRGMQNCVKILRRVASACSQHGIKLGLEAVNRYESNVINTLQDGARLIQRIDEPNVMLHADLYHMHIEESNMTRELRRHCASGVLQYFHIGASHRGYLGEGSEDLRGAMRALADGGYTGPLVFESFSSAVVDQNLTSALAIWRNLWTDSDHLASHARAVIQTEWDSASKLARAPPEV